ncbi:DUF2306 domain-containing protein [Actinophytocola algeriensis]|uniref:Uncharacterized membrane protein YozB (DUF420 family) n=1 Tax=Actinophytocola algeriensis TaxID=1768010 RepID=A0A7W7Q6B1_9PSEU|nr:DUF2306 domain-containing protein [Actinophytocola algeriensis]MBB4907732.1 uncharacterized membrane protein YozB (DUF420 family) [Actinophytocola algeriensis]MBE1479762.1 uncharacterized membrane protein YozB (DUF420 family) [Actinophytocola algeriensis]
MTTLTRTRWRVPAALLALSAVPVLAGAFRVTQLSTGAAVTPENARFFADPVPVVLHIVGASLFCVLGAFQFPRGPRHRVLGRLIVPCGLVAALSGMWMAVVYPLPAHDGDLLMVLRLVFGSAMAAALVLGVAAVRRRDFGTHRGWMIRGYAIGQGGGTQAVLFGFWTAAEGDPDVTTRALLLGAGWVLNLVVAEWLIRRKDYR